MLNVTQNYAITGTTPSSATTAVVGTAIDTYSLDSSQTTKTAAEVADDVDIIADLIGATGGTLDVYLQTSEDSTDGSNGVWTDIVHFPQQAAGGGAKTYRLTMTRGTQTSVIQQVGHALAPALAVNTMVGGTVPRWLRVVAVGGASTTLGASITIKIRSTGNKRSSFA